MKKVLTYTNLGIAALALITGCGSSTTTTLGTAGSSSTSSTSSITSATTTTSSSSSSSSTSSSTSGENLLPAITSSFSLAGTRGNVTNSAASTSIVVNTDNLLKVTVTAGSAGTLTVPGYGFSANYGCVNFKITVEGQTVVTNTLSTGLGSDSDCSGAATSQTIDFSSRMTTGHGPVTVTVTSNDYDFDCMSCRTYPWLYGYYCNNYCPMDLVYKNHTVNGTLSIQVNGTGS